MLKPDFLKRLADQLCDAVPSHLGSIKKDFEKNCQRVLNSSFSKLEMITREEFDAQSKVLARTRQKIETLEKHVKDLENKLKAKHRHE